MTLYVKNNDIVRVFKDGSVNSYNDLEPLTYTVNDSDSGLCLSIVDNFEIPAKIYGTAVEDADRFLTTFNNRSGNLGVLLVGDKGSGKTLTAKNTATVGREKFKLPTLLINESINGNLLGPFLSSINCECIIIFDEFEKNYKIRNSEEKAINHQHSLLTVLDGVYSGKKMFILTCNDIHKIDDHFINRPGRIYYYKNYSSVCKKFIEDYIEDNLTKCASDDFKKNLINKVKIIQMNFDSLKAIVEESNIYYDKPIDWILKDMNIGQEDNNEYRAYVRFKDSNDEWLDCGLYSNILTRHPLMLNVECGNNESITTHVTKLNTERGKLKYLTYLILNAEDYSHTEDDGSIIYIKDDFECRYIKSVTETRRWFI